MVIHYQVRDLLWRPAGRLVRFVAVIHPTRGSGLLMGTGTSLAATGLLSRDWSEPWTHEINTMTLQSSWNQVHAW
jgi:hypothetical protein